jgi:Trp operon repressor
MSANEAVLRVRVLFMVSPLGTTMIAGLIDNKLNIGIQCITRPGALCKVPCNFMGHLESRISSPAPVRPVVD